MTAHWRRQVINADKIALTLNSTQWGFDTFVPYPFCYIATTSRIIYASLSFELDFWNSTIFLAIPKPTPSPIREK